MKDQLTLKAERDRAKLTKARSVQRIVGEPTEIFSGSNSIGMWNHINEAKTIDELRMALYVVTCRCQELESEVRRLSNS